MPNAPKDQPIKVGNLECTPTSGAPSCTTLVEPTRSLDHVVDGETGFRYIEKVLTAFLPNG